MGDLPSPTDKGLDQVLNLTAQPLFIWIRYQLKIIAQAI
jgi:hypothetical protein